MSDPESPELALSRDSKWALLKPNLEPQRETTLLCILLGCSLASSWAQGHSPVSREMGFLSSQPSIWPTCLNSAPLANAEADGAGRGEACVVCREFPVSSH